MLINNDMEMQNSEIIALNFLPLINSNFKFKIYLREFNHTDERWDPEIRQYRLPNDNKEYKKYWVSLRQFENSKFKEISSKDNLYLTNYYLYKLLLNAIKKNKVEFEDEKQGFYQNRIYIILEELKEGKKCIWFEPYYLKVKNQFGFFTDYSFKKDQDYVFDKKVQQLSLSLDSNYQSNKNYHIDKLRIIQGFIEKNSFLLHLNHNIEVSDTFVTLGKDSLDTKVYIFNSKSELNSQFKGIMQFGPFQGIANSNSIQYYFLFHKSYKEFADDLIRALNGETYLTFKGIDKFNLPKHTKVNTKGVNVNSYSDNLVKELNEIKNEENIDNKIAIAIFPKKEELFYYKIKNNFLKYDIPLQGVHIETIQDEGKLKWSVSSIALQMFTKLGGIPWLVKESNSNCLIVGIGQAHENENHRIIDYFAYSVLLESSGKFLKIQPLAKSFSKAKYMEQLADEVKKIIVENENKYSKIVFHIPEKIRKEDIEKIEETLKEINSGIELYIVKINDKSKYFGYNLQENSLVPYESSYIKLSNKEFLLWTEGLNYHNKKVLKRYANPLHVEFYYSNVEKCDYKSFLQDILNLSGANYRGFNSKALPVSVYYPKLVARFIKYFNELKLSYEVQEKDKLWFI